MTPQNLSTLAEGRRRATLIAYLLERSAGLTDQALGIHERMMIKAHLDSRKARDEISREREKEAGQTVIRYAGVGNALIVAREEGLEPFEVIENFIPWETFVQSVGEAQDLAQRNSGSPDYLQHMEDHYRRLRRYAPLLLESFDFEAAPPAASLVEAAGILEELNASGKRKVPDDAPTAFVKPAWEPYVFDEDGSIDRHNYEMSLLSGLKDGLGSGDVWVSGSNKFKDFEDYLLPRGTHQEMRSRGEIPVAMEPDPKAYVKDRNAKLHGELCKVSRLLAGDRLEGVRLKDGKLRVTRPKREEPKGMKEFRRRIYGFLPRIRLTDLIVEVDSWTAFSEHLTHVRSGEPCTAKELTYAGILADGTNLGLTRMAEATDDPRVSYKRLSWAADWHIREDTYLKATAEIVNAHYSLPFTSHWGEGTTSSSDGQVFFAGGPRDALSQPNAKYGRGPSVIFYTHISDQYAPFYSQVVNTTVRDATYVLDGLLYHESDLEIQEHSTDTEGFTDQIFGACYLLGYRFVPRIRNIKDMNLYSIEKPSRYKDLASRMGGKINMRIISSQWDELSRLMGSIKTGSVTASLILRKLANYPRQNGLAKALREIGKIERTLFILDWYQDVELRRRVNANLNKGEARNSLARAVFFNRLGELRDRSYEDQMNRASGLSLLCAAIAMWNAVYLERAVEGLRALGEEVPEEYIAHLSPLEWEHITLTGIYRWNLDSPTQQSNGLRPLRGLTI